MQAIHASHRNVQHHAVGFFGNIVATATAPGILGSTAGISTTLSDPVPCNNSARMTRQVRAIEDLIAAKTATPLSVPAGAPIAYVATARNNGPSTAQNVQAVDVLPANVAFVSISALGGGSCATAAAAQLDILVNKMSSADPVDLGQPTTYTINNSGLSFGTNVGHASACSPSGSIPMALLSSLHRGPAYFGGLQQHDGRFLLAKGSRWTGTLVAGNSWQGRKNQSDPRDRRVGL
jgi:uncharacterized repeat protein (TIGR01451 family)